MAGDDRDNRADDDEDDERPRRRRRRDEDEDDERPQVPPKNGAATASMVLGVLSFCFSGLSGIPAIIFGIIGMNRSKERRGAGHGTALTGLILGIVGTMFSIPVLAIALGLTLPAVQKVREAATRAKTSNDLKQIGLAAHNHDAVYGYAPQNLAAGLQPSPQGDANPLYQFSWRVAVLPFLEQDSLYKRIDKNQPWNGPNNQFLATTGVKPFEGVDAGVVGATRVRGFIGQGTMLEPGARIPIAAGVPDGTSNTWLYVEHRDAVPWPEPNDVRYDASGIGPVPPVPALGAMPNSRTASILFVDGSVRVVSTAKLTPSNVRMFISRNDGFMPNFAELDP